jgi:hypothetical protein
MMAWFPCAELSADNWVGLALWCAAVVVAIAALGLGMLWAKKFAARSLKGRSQSGNELTIEKFEEMHRSGLISREEFSSLRRAALGLGPGAAIKAAPGRLSPPQPSASPAAEAPPGGNDSSLPKSDLTDRPSDVDEDKKNQPPGPPPAQA